MTAATATDTFRFVRRTTLNPDEYRKNFRQIDSDVIATLTSAEASLVTPQMSKIYLSLINTSSQYWEREGVLRFAGYEREGKWLTAWQQLVELVGVASSTARKAFQWMAQQGIIGYYAGKNGVGIRIFINRAASSIGQKPNQPQKNLRLVQASTTAPRTSTDEAGFKESHADIENLEIDFIPHAPKGGAAEINTHCESSGATSISQDDLASIVRATTIDSNAIAERIARDVLPQVRSAAAREHERTREWFIKDALPKAIRVAQRSAYDVLRANGAISEPQVRGSSSGQSRCNDREVGKNTMTGMEPRHLDEQEINELAESCVALLVTQGRATEQTLSEISIETGGFLLPKDALKVRTRIEALTAGKANQNNGREGNVC